MNKKNLTMIASVITVLVGCNSLQAGPKKAPVRRVLTARPVATSNTVKPVVAAKTTGSVPSVNKENEGSVEFKTLAELEDAFNDFVKRYPAQEAQLRQLESDLKSKAVSRVAILLKMTKASLSLPSALTVEVKGKFPTLAALDAAMSLARV